MAGLLDKWRLPSSDYRMGTPPGGQPQAPPSRPGLGTRLFGKGWEGKAAALGGMLQGDQDAVSQYHQMQQVPLLQEAERQRRREDMQWEWANKPRETSPYRFEDNAGNVYERDPATGQNRLIFTDPNDKMFLQDGQLVTVPNRVRTGQPSAGGPQPGAIVNGHRFHGGNPNDRANWEPVGQGGPQLAPAGGFRP